MESVEENEKLPVKCEENQDYVVSWKLRIYIREKNKNMVNAPESDHGS